VAQRATKMSIEVNNSELYQATSDIVSDIFGVEVSGVDTVTTIVADVYDLPESALGSVTNGESELLIQLGGVEIDQFARFFDFTEDMRPDIYRYVAASMFAGYIVANSVARRNQIYSEASEVFNQVLIDQDPIVKLLEDCALRSFGSYETPERVFKKVAERDPLEIATINMHRIGSGLVLFAEQRLGQNERHELSDDMIASLNENINKQTTNDTLTFEAAGLKHPYAQGRIASTVMERLIRQRGIGLAFPYTIEEINVLKMMLAEASDTAHEHEIMIRKELAGEESTEGWREIVELSGGYVEVDPAYMQVDTPE
jgi:hypothetical protein